MHRVLSISRVCEQNADWACCFWRAVPSQLKDGFVRPPLLPKDKLTPHCFPLHCCLKQAGQIHMSNPCPSSICHYALLRCTKPWEKDLFLFDLPGVKVPSPATCLLSLSFSMVSHKLSNLTIWFCGLVCMGAPPHGFKWADIVNPDN